MGCFTGLCPNRESQTPRNWTHAIRVIRPPLCRARPGGQHLTQCSSFRGSQGPLFRSAAGSPSAGRFAASRGASSCAMGMNGLPHSGSDTTCLHCIIPRQVALFQQNAQLRQRRGGGLSDLHSNLHVKGLSQSRCALRFQGGGICSSRRSSSSSSSGLAWPRRALRLSSASRVARRSASVATARPGSLAAPPGLPVARPGSLAAPHPQRAGRPAGPVAESAPGRR